MQTQCNYTNTVIYYRLLITSEKFKYDAYLSGDFFIETTQEFLILREQVELLQMSSTQQIHPLANLKNRMQESSNSGAIHIPERHFNGYYHILV